MQTLHFIRVQLPSREAIREFTERWQLDYGDQLQAGQNEKGFSISAMAGEKQMAELKKANIPVTIIERFEWDEIAMRKLVGQGDRYKGGKLIPKRLI